MKTIIVTLGLFLCYLAGMVTYRYGDSAPETYLAALFLITYLFVTRRYWHPSFVPKETKEKTNL